MGHAFTKSQVIKLLTLPHVKLHTWISRIDLYKMSFYWQTISRVFTKLSSAEIRAPARPPPLAWSVGADPIHQNFNQIVGLVQITNKRLPHNSHNFGPP